MMYAYLTEIGNTYTQQDAILRRVPSTRSVLFEFIDIHTGQWKGFGSLVEVEPVTDPGDERHERCSRCGSDPQPVSALERQIERYYNWDDPDEDAQGSILHTREVWKCSDKAACDLACEAGLLMTMIADERNDAALYQRGTGQGWGVQ